MSIIVLRKIPKSEKTPTSKPSTTGVKSPCVAKASFLKNEASTEACSKTLGIPFFRLEDSKYKSFTRVPLRAFSYCAFVIKCLMNPVRNLLLNVLFIRSPALRICF